MVWKCPYQYLYAYIEMTLLALHVVYIGVTIGITAHVAFSIGKKDGMRAAERQQELKGEKESTTEIKN